MPFITYTKVGTVTDRWGPQRVSLAGGIMLSMGLDLLSIARGK